MLRKIGRILLKLAGLALLIFVLALLILGRLIEFRVNDKDLLSFFRQRHITPVISYYHAKEREVRYIEVGHDTGATILFIHGAPSSLSYWKGYLSDSDLLHRATMYAVDRPGYGYSGLGDPLPDIATQASIIKLILDSLHQAHRPVVVVGVSYGAPIAARLVMDNPQLVNGLVLMAPPLGPGREKIFWFTYLIENPLIHWIIPPMLQSANREKVHHKEELTKMLPLWSGIHIPVAYLQGMEDGLVDTSNATFAKTHLINAPSLSMQMIPGRGHLIAFAEKDRVKKTILDMLDKCGAP